MRLGPQAGAEADLGPGTLVDSPAWSVEGPCPACSNGQESLPGRRRGLAGAVLLGRVSSGT
eukprot:13406547-Alexandrium_andersonii.AAC.1